eukprot:gnl/TRDRNA2_/TRDRNA2_38085_c0_seq1.p1 gnl/TRDRNA2_/TRDRNA2_38085_c0~~gnl/TRDRNA2_/TRDRNA2_38085_c0_seq1.p1  ORF type:complete len:359 (-),score=67.35 gnl/TRDRNA2_/TRDRNA2_38085_c0_seq1:97-1098(-)
MVWHDRDADIYYLRTACQDAHEALAKTSVDPDIATQDAQRMMVISSEIPDIDTFRSAVRRPEWVVEYDFHTTTIERLSHMIEEKARTLKARTVAFANHGVDDEGMWQITKDCCINVKDRKPQELDPQAALFFRTLAASAEHRVDLLACDLASEPNGLSLIHELEALTGKNIAASTDHTGNLKRGGDWIMETDNVDTASIYFDAFKLYKWEGILRSHRAAKERLEQLHDLRTSSHETAAFKAPKKPKGKPLRIPGRGLVYEDDDGNDNTNMDDMRWKGPLSAPYSDSESDHDGQMIRLRSASRRRLEVLRHNDRAAAYDVPNKHWGGGTGSHHS